MIRLGWDPARAAVVICDMWDAHHCVSAARRVAGMAPQMNVVVAGLHERGALIVHASADCMAFYQGTPARRLAMQAPVAQSPVPIAWNEWTADEKASLPARLTAPRPCSCASAEICGEAGLLSP